MSLTPKSRWRFPSWSKEILLQEGSRKFPLFSFAWAVNRTCLGCYLNRIIKLSLPCLHWTQKATWYTYFPCRLVCLTFSGREEHLRRMRVSTEIAVKEEINEDPVAIWLWKRMRRNNVLEGVSIFPALLPNSHLESHVTCCADAH